MIAYVVRFLPIATGSLAAGLDRVSSGIEDAARTLGAKPRELVLRIQLPLLRPALASAALLVFVDCLKELPATLLLRPLNAETLATLVYGPASRGAFEDGLARRAGHRAGRHLAGDPPRAERRGATGLLIADARGRLKCFQATWTRFAIKLGTTRNEPSPRKGKRL